MVNSDFSSYNYMTRFIVELYNLSLKLILHNTITPELFKCDDKLTVKWIPCTSNIAVNNIINEVSIRAPHDLITFNRETFQQKIW